MKNKSSLQKAIKATPRNININNLGNPYKSGITNKPVFTHELNGASIDVYKNSIILKTTAPNGEKIYHEFEWKEIFATLWANC